MYKRQGTYFKSKLRHRKLHSTCLASALTSLPSPSDLWLLIAHHFASSHTCHITDLDISTTKPRGLTNAQSGSQHSYCLLAQFRVQYWSVKLVDKTICCETISSGFPVSERLQLFQVVKPSPLTQLSICRSTAHLKTSLFPSSLSASHQPSSSSITSPITAVIGISSDTTLFYLSTITLHSSNLSFLLSLLTHKTPSTSTPPT